VLAITHTSPEKLTLEVTESVYLEDTERAHVVLDGLKKLGVGLALDDFGTGYSSLGYLQRFPIDTVKIDRTFVCHLQPRSPSGAIVESIIHLSHALNKTVVAEGVETSQQHEQLVGLGCDSCQGYYFALPMSADDLGRRLQLS
jgi:EAL domain-containing protein (putative c-di-GMP-specific phosphodiesterase class I)